MSENELLQEIKSIFLHLTDQEPTPDEEIEARDQLIERFESLQFLDAFPLQISLIENILNKLKNWDTLDLWFKEVEGLAENIDKFLRLTGVKKELAKIQAVEESGKILESKASPDVEVPQLDVSDIVFQVTEQFKDEIGGLKDTIEQLKIELDSKEERIKELADKKPVQVITPKKEVKLEPPKIKIPSIKRPEKAPHIKVHLEQRAEEITSIPIPTKEEAGFEFEEEMEIPEITEETLTEQIKLAEALEKPKLSPVISEIPPVEAKSDIPFQVTQIPSKEEELEEEEVKLTPIPTEKPEIMKIAEDDAKLTSLPAEKPETMKPVEFDTEFMPIPSELITKISEVTEEPMIPSTSTEEVLKTPEAEEKPILTPIISKKPKISPISIEEIDTETIKSSGTDLFDVLSSVASRSSEQTLEPQTSTEPKPVPVPFMAEKKEIPEVKPKEVEPILKKVEPIAPPETIFVEPEKSVEALPKDKDSLYQELIALEGRRYSLEKSYKDLSSSYGSGIIDEFEFNSRSEGLKNQLDEISSRITKIRRIIASL